MKFRFLTVLLAFSIINLGGCNSKGSQTNTVERVIIVEDSQEAASPEIEVTFPVKEESEDINSEAEEIIIDIPIEEEEVETELVTTTYLLTPTVSSAVYEEYINLVEGYYTLKGKSNDIWGSKIYTWVDDPLTFEEYTVDLSISHRHNSWVCVRMEDDLWIVGYYKNDGWTWSDLNIGCSYMSTPYTYEEVVMYYGDKKIKKGTNFTLSLQREENWTVKWNVSYEKEELVEVINTEEEE